MAVTHVKMKRHPDLYPVTPHTALVHVTEVGNWTPHGWCVVSEVDEEDVHFELFGEDKTGLASADEKSVKSGKKGIAKADTDPIASEEVNGADAINTEIDKTVK